MKTVYVVVEDEIDYDYEETPYLMEVRLHKVFHNRDKAEEFIVNQSQLNNFRLVEVELVEE